MTSSRERVMAALDFRRPDRIPRYDSYWPEFVEAWRKAKGLAASASIDDYYGIDIRIAAGDETLAPTRATVLEETDRATLQRDGWGRVIRTVPGAFFYQQVANAIESTRDLDRLVVDRPDLGSRYASLDRVMSALRERFCVFAKVGGPFIRSQFVRGDANLLCDMAADPGFARAIVSAIARHLTAIGLEELRRWRLHDTGIWVFDDMASNRGPLFSPRMADDILVPAWAEMVAAFKAAGARKVILHSDGNILPLLDRFIEIGFDGIHPVEPKAGMDLPTLRARYGRRLALLGGLDNAHILPRGDPDEVGRHVRRALAAGREGGVVMGMHSVGCDVSVAIYDYLIRLSV